MSIEPTMQGLSESVAAERIKREGYNELPSEKKKNIFHILIQVLREPMLLLLIGSGLIYFLLGEPKDALMLLSFVAVVVGITFYQERKTARALEALRDLSSPRSLVIREGQQKRIATRNVVRDDIVMLKEGDRVPADAVVLTCSNLSIDESLLTGESVPVRKAEWDGKELTKRPGGEDLPFVYSGTLVVQGRGMAKVTSVGIQTEMGKIGKALRDIREEDMLLQKEMGRIVRVFATVGIALCLLVVLIYGLTRGSWLNGILSGLTLSMAMLPEEFPVVLVIFLTLGAWRLSQSQVLTRRNAAIETLGAATVLCTDKTGTLTLNAQRLVALCVDGKYYDVDTEKSKAMPEATHALMEYSILASQRDPFDPIEKEVKRVGELYLAPSEHPRQDWKLVREYTLSKKLLALSHVWESPDHLHYVIASKGSPEAIADLCHFDAEQTARLMLWIEAMANKGLRVLGVAEAVFQKTNLPPEQHDFPCKFIGLLGFIDPIRENVPASVKEAHGAGIRVVMITGDYPGTAIHIAKEIGLKDPQNIITGPELEKMDPVVLQERIKTVNVFARVVPEQKLAIVNAFKANGEIVAMTGDGVNDAPALKSAHIGIAMGERGTDVAREASALVLLNDDFSSIVEAVKLGRRIFDNLKKSIAFIFSVHIPIAGMVFFPVLLKMPIALLPAHIAFLELIIDPACSTIFESCQPERNIMSRPPRNLKESLFNRKAFSFSLLQGLSVLGVVFFVYSFALNLQKSDAEARTLAFATLVFANIMLILTNLSWTKSLLENVRSKNRAMGWVIGGTLVALFTAVFVPFFRDLFHFSALSFANILIAFAGGMISLIWFEGLKFLKKRANQTV